MRLLLPPPAPAATIILASVLLASCGDDEKDVATPATTPTATATPTAEPVATSPLDGDWEIDIAEADLTPTAGAEPGHWTLRIEGDDASLHGPGGRNIPLSPTVLSPTRMKVPADPECPNNRPAPGPGRYVVRLRGDALRFKKLEDPCGDRGFNLTVHVWRRAA